MVKMIGYRFRFCKDSETEWTYRSSIFDVMVHMMENLEEADDNVISTLTSIFSAEPSIIKMIEERKALSSALSSAFISFASLLKPKPMNAFEKLAKLINHELVSPSHLLELGNFEIEEIEGTFPGETERYLFDLTFGVASGMSMLEVGYPIDDIKIKVISEPKVLKTHDLVS